MIFKDVLAMEGTGRGRLILTGRCDMPSSLSDLFSSTGGTKDTGSDRSAHIVESLSVWLLSASASAFMARRSLVLEREFVQVRNEGSSAFCGSPKIDPSSLAERKVGMSGSTLGRLGSPSLATGATWGLS